MDDITGTIVRLIKETDLTHRDDLLLEARRAFLDYLASLYRAVGRQKVKAAAHWAQGFAGKGLMVGQKGTSYPIFAAFYNGFASHYLDLDDAPIKYCRSFQYRSFFRPPFCYGVAAVSQRLLDRLCCGR